MTILEFIKMFDPDVVMKCTFKIVGKSSWFFYFIQDDSKDFDWQKVTYDEMEKWYKDGIKWLETQGPGSYEIKQIMDLTDELTDNPDNDYIKYRFQILCKY